MGRYEDYNEMMYEAYCKAAIDNAVLKARLKKATQGQSVCSLSELSDSELYPLSKDWEEELPEEYPAFHVQGRTIHVKDLRLGRALTNLLPRDRKIILFYYFWDLRDKAIARWLKISRATVQRCREAAQKKLKMILEEGP